MPVRISDVAFVNIGPGTRRGGLDKEGVEAVGGVVIARYGSNPLEVINNIKDKIKEMAPGLPQKTLPDGTVSKITVVPFYPILTAFMDGRVRDFHTFMKTRFILQILYKNATQYLQYLRIIDKKSEVIENKLHQSQKNEELIELLELQKSLVYFTTSLRSNEVVLEKLLRIDKIKKYPEDTDLLEDVIVENKQAMEMTSIYNGILSGTMDTFASVISNNLNIVMKFLATVTIVMSIPTMVASFYGMNVRASGMPFAEHPYGFGIVLFFTLVLTLIVAYIFNKKDLF